MTIRIAGAAADVVSAVGQHPFPPVLIPAYLPAVNSPIQPTIRGPERAARRYLSR